MIALGIGFHRLKVLGRKGYKKYALPEEEDPTKKPGFLIFGIRALSGAQIRSFLIF